MPPVSPGAGVRPVSTRDLILLLGAPLAHDDPALAADPARDRALMIEAPGEATAIWNHYAEFAIMRSRSRPKPGPGF